MFTSYLRSQRHCKQLCAHIYACVNVCCRQQVEVTTQEKSDKKTAADINFQLSKISSDEETFLRDAPQVVTAPALYREPTVVCRSGAMSLLEAKQLFYFAVIAPSLMPRLRG